MGDGCNRRGTPGAEPARYRRPGGAGRAGVAGGSRPKALHRLSSCWAPMAAAAGRLRALGGLMPTDLAAGAGVGIGTPSLPEAGPV